MAALLTCLAFGDCQGNVFGGPAVISGAWDRHLQLLPRCHDSKAALQALRYCIEGQPGVDLHLRGRWWLMILALSPLPRTPLSHEPRRAQDLPHLVLIAHVG
ncbi:hypothetical protein HaLaN_28467 [Haematococcus lacustris]|uniref:Uncharacterized protein n=1 Tax=Haematococcus lacustris TaxID=44745 RepID=A0A6A0AAV4_HAELA|nr:hypothetical protein HaLaN_28467 [Haematococcus lacustris]